MAHFKKGVLVHLKTSDGVPNRSSRYKIRSIGKKQAVLDRMPPEGQPLPTYKTRGYSVYLNDQEQIDSYINIGRPIPSYFKTSWEQHFVLAGDNGWDPEEN